MSDIFVESYLRDRTQLIWIEDITSVKMPLSDCKNIENSGQEIDLSNFPIPLFGSEFPKSICSCRFRYSILA
jgi:hypothetical protein